MARFTDNYGDPVYIENAGREVSISTSIDSRETFAVLDVATSRRIRKALKKAEKRALRGI